jgi:hypothetical protein
MGPGSVAVLDVGQQGASQVTPVEKGDVIGALAVNRDDDALDIRILPGRSGWLRRRTRRQRRCDPCCSPRRFAEWESAIPARPAVHSQVQHCAERKRTIDRAHSCTCRKSDSHVVMMEAAEDGDRGDLAELLGWPANG